eukprot:Clim_evm1s19 gene=Clim_evmTU1s19
MSYRIDMGSKRRRGTRKELGDQESELIALKQKREQRNALDAKKKYALEAKKKKSNALLRANAMADVIIGGSSRRTGNVRRTPGISGDVPLHDPQSSTNQQKEIIMVVDDSDEADDFEDVPIEQSPVVKTELDKIDASPVELVDEVEDCPVSVADDDDNEVVDRGAVDANESSFESVLSQEGQKDDDSGIGGDGNGAGANSCSSATGNEELVEAEKSPTTDSRTQPKKPKGGRRQRKDYSAEFNAVRKKLNVNFQQFVSVFRAVEYTSSVLRHRGVAVTQERLQPAVDTVSAGFGGFTLTQEILAKICAVGENIGQLRYVESTPVDPPQTLGLPPDYRFGRTFEMELLLGNKKNFNAHTNRTIPKSQTDGRILRFAEALLKRQEGGAESLDDLPQASIPAAPGMLLKDFIASLRKVKEQQGHQGRVMGRSEAEQITFEADPNISPSRVTRSKARKMMESALVTGMTTSKRFSETGHPSDQALSEDPESILTRTSIPSDAERAEAEPLQGRPTTHEEDRRPLSVFDFVEFIKTEPYYHEQICHIERYPAREAQYDDTLELTDVMRRALQQSKGITRMFSHQGRAIRAIRQGKNLVICTATSSGKSLCYNVPVIERCMEKLDDYCAIFLFPTKALAQDQMRAFRELCCLREMENIRIATYDGDTPQAERQNVRESKLRRQVILSNPDMLHATILPNHAQWPDLFRQVRYVIIDEGHIYRGVFGSHVACVMRRFVRCCEAYGNRPQFVMCSATIANPIAHFRSLVPLDLDDEDDEEENSVVLVDEDGSPRGAKAYVLWNPPLKSEAELLRMQQVQIRGKEKYKGNRNAGPAHAFEMGFSYRKSPNVEISNLLHSAIKHQLRTIAFCKVRHICELVLDYTLRRIRDSADEDLLDLVTSYRGGYSVEERRKIEYDLFHGHLLGVVATSALELGVDIGVLDMTLQLGFPGSIASLWQQSGRAGRGIRESVSILIAYEGAIDQYYMANPERLFGTPSEEAICDPTNENVLWEHVLCAAFEFPLTTNEDRYFGVGFFDVVKLLCKGFRPSGQNCGGPFLRSHPGGWHHVHGVEKPTSKVSIRFIESERILLYDRTSGLCIDEVELTRALYEVYEGAVYLYRGQQYLVEQVDYDKLTAHARPVTTRYYTKQQDTLEIDTMRVVSSKLIGSLPLNYGRARIETGVYGFRKIWIASGQTFDVVNMSVPHVGYHSFAAWVDVPTELKQECLHLNFSFKGSTHACAHAVLAIVPLFLMCERADIGVECISPHEQRARPLRILLFDQRPGGIGLAERGFHIFPRLLRAAKDIMDACPCQDGCPSCIHDFNCREYNAVMDKQGGIHLLGRLLELQDLDPSVQIQEQISSDPAGDPLPGGFDRGIPRSFFSDSFGAHRPVDEDR